VIFNSAQVIELANQFELIISKEELVEAIKSFSWGGISGVASLEERDKAAVSFQNWAKAGFPDDRFDTEIQKVHIWGFRQPLSKSTSHILSEPHRSVISECMKTWYANSDISERRKSLIEALKIKSIGIARLSKWVCFLDQEAYAIYDSRVSLALRRLRFDGQRAFPTIGRRSSAKTKYPYQSYLGKDSFQVAENITSAYLNFLALLDALKLRYHISSSSEIEKGLFMLGQDPRYWE